MRWLFIAAALFATSSTAAPSFPVEMVTEYCWDGVPCGEVDWTFYEDGTGVDGFGNDARWRYRSGMLRWEYTSTGTLYEGRFDGECFNGVMNRVDGDFGEFSACRG